jgi:predicted CXXCH cytochrome family protein
VNALRKERPPTSDKRSLCSLKKVLAAVGVLCVFIWSSRAVGSPTTNSAPAAVTNAPVAKPESHKHHILKLLFDGVPEEGATNVVRVPAKRTTATKRPSVLSAFHFSQGSLSNYVMHPPFAKQECTQCHGGSKLNPVLKAPQKDLCMQCHKKNFAAPMPVMHKPVELGQCSNCHDPHKSLNKKLLLKAGNDLCLKCHQAKMAEPVKHAAVEMNGCLECHLPHGGPNKFLTKVAADKLCYQCHDDFATTAKFVHAPVQSGDCTQCHNPHSTRFEKLLTHKGADTCYECHDDFQNQIKTAKVVHAPMQDNNCTMCHDPHGTNERFMLKKSGNGVCFECHEEKDMAAISGHAGAQSKRCADCHNPHFSEQKHLLKTIVNKLTAKE